MKQRAKMEGRKIADLAGAWTIRLPDGRSAEGVLPGSLDTNGIGDPDAVAGAWHPDVEERLAKMVMDQSADRDPRIATRLTRNHVWEGIAEFSRTLPDQMEIPENARIFLRAERARKMTLRVDGQEIPALSGTLSTPWLFEVTGAVRPGGRIEMLIDNSYMGWPRRDIVFSSAATDETQTNWNGAIGEIGLYAEPEMFIDDLRVLPRGGRLRITGSVFLPRKEERPQNGWTLRLTGDCLPEPLLSRIPFGPEKTENGSWRRQGDRMEFDLRDVNLSEDWQANRWDEGEGKLAEIRAALIAPDGETVHQKQSRFGIRDIGYDGMGRLTLNGRRFFLRGEANCAVFPETGYPPMKTEEWRDILRTYASYGVNCLRCHSWCPPEAAFAAADELGMMVQPELSHWNPRDAFMSPESRAYYRQELREILRAYGNHPSFVMLTLGNELHTSQEGVEFMRKLLRMARETDDTRLYAWGSNNFYGSEGADPESGFYTSSEVRKHRLRACGNAGPLNREYPGGRRNFDAACEALRKDGFEKPVFGFEVGQYQVLPDFGQLADFRGVTRPDNLALVRDRLQRLGMSETEWRKRVEASGELSLLCYREDVESVLRTEGMSGISLLGLQDFPGQGTALVGMLDAHLKAKPFDFARPERTASFFRPVSLLALFARYTWTEGETFEAEIRVLNYGRSDLRGDVKAELREGETIRQTASPGQVHAAPGEAVSAGIVRFVLKDMSQATRLNLRICCGEVSTTYPLWVYPPVTPACPEEIYETVCFDERAREVLRAGGRVYLSPPSIPEAMPCSVQAQFATDFWSVGTFPDQEGAMGQLISAEHPLFRRFPTEFYSNWQWWPMASQRALKLPAYWDCIVAEMDSYAKLRPLGRLIEAKCGGGRILISSYGLQGLQQYPEARALLAAIYDYLTSADFAPTQELAPEEIEKLAPRVV